MLYRRKVKRPSSEGLKGATVGFFLLFRETNSKKAMGTGHAQAEKRARFVIVRWVLFFHAQVCLLFVMDVHGFSLVQ